MVYNTTQHLPPTPHSHTLFISGRWVYMYCTFTLGRGRGGGGLRELRGATVHKRDIKY
jgi:hypothetical protein